MQSTPKSSFDISFRTHFLEARPGKGGEIQTGGGKGEGGLKGRWQGHSSEPGTAAGGRASMHCSYQPSPPQTLAGLSFAKHYCTYSTAEAVEFGHRRRICIPPAPPTGSTLRAPRIWMPPRQPETPPNPWRASPIQTISPVPQIATSDSIHSKFSYKC